MPKKGEKILGGHAVELVGYDDASKTFTVRNSWGPNWADHGYFHMPYAFLTGSQGGQAYVDEIWTAD
jgi:C1A family cysteine protease